MPDINLSPYTAESQAIARKLRMAEALQQQSMTPLEQPQQAGVKVSPYAGLAKLLQGYTSGQMQNRAQTQQEELGKRYAADTGADFQSLAKLLSAPAQAAVPEGAPTYTPNIGAGELADNARMTMQPERNEMGEIIQPGQPGAGNFGITPGAPAQAAIAAGRLTPEGFGAMKTPMGQQQYMAQFLGQMAPKAPIKLGKDESLLSPTDFRVLAQGPVDAEKGMAPLNPKDFTPESWKSATSGGGINRSLLVASDKEPEANRSISLAIAAAGIDPKSTEGKQIFRNLIAKQTAIPQGTNVRIENKMGEGAAAQIGPMMKDSLDIATGAVKQVDAANRIVKAIDKGQIIAGVGAGGRVTLAQLGQVLGVGGPDDAAKLANTRQVIRGLAEMTLQGRSQMKGQGAITESEGLLAEKATSGRIEDLTIPEIRQLAIASDRAARFSYAEHERKVKEMGRNPAMSALVPYYQGPAMPSAFSDKPPAGAVRRVP